MTPIESFRRYHVREMVKERVILVLILLVVAWFCAWATGADAFVAPNHPVNVQDPLNVQQIGVYYDGTNAYPMVNERPATGHRLAQVAAEHPMLTNSILVHMAKTNQPLVPNKVRLVRNGQVVLESEMPPTPPDVVRTRIGTAPGLSVAWDASLSVGVVGYKVYSGTQSGRYTASFSAGLALSATIPWLPWTNWLAATAIGPDGLESDFSNEISVVNTNAVQDVTMWLSATNAFFSNPMTLGQKAGEFGLTSTVDNQGNAGFSVNIPMAAQYVVWSRVLISDSGSDSFFVNVDGTEDVFDAGTNYSPAWQWSKLVGRTPPGPRLLNLTNGTHTIAFRGREAGTWLSGFWLSSNTNFAPVVVTNGPTVVSFVVSVESAPTPTGPFTTLSNVAAFSVTNSPANQFIRSKVSVTRQ